MDFNVPGKHIKTKQLNPPTISNGTLEGNDIAGMVDFTSVANAGVQTTITFKFPYRVAPVVVLTPQNVNGAVNDIGYYVQSTVNTFTINSVYTSAPKNYKFNYFVVQAE